MDKKLILLDCGASIGNQSHCRHSHRSDRAVSTLILAICGCLFEGTGPHIKLSC